MATIKDVASKAGVSITTVSRVMNDRGPLSEATKKAFMTRWRNWDIFQMM